MQGLWFPSKGVLRLQQLVRTSRYLLVELVTRARVIGHTGGCSSSFSPLSGLALRFAKTPSLCDPPPYTLPGTAAANAGRCVILRSITAGLPSEVTVVAGVTGPSCSVALVDGDPLISLCLSSPSLSSSLSDPSASKASVNVASTCREVGDEARDRKDGGGDVGVCAIGLVGELAPSSLPETCIASVRGTGFIVGVKPSLPLPKRGKLDASGGNVPLTLS